MPPLPTFQTALNSCQENNGKAHLLLGNGFSRAFRDDIFSYGSLFDAADLSFSDHIRPAFAALDTTDFEATIKGLQTASKLVAVYASTDGALASRLADDATRLKTVLAETVARNHPDDPNSISEGQYESCRLFLRPFDRIYTFNYDLLLYWVLIKQLNNPSIVDHEKIQCDDGFRSENASDEYVVWDGDHNQNVYYLHGALHLYQGQAELRKYTWARTDVPIMRQVRTALENDLFPLFVSEGTSRQKRGAILRNGYLTKCLRSFKGLGGSIITFGASLSERDSHVLDVIAKSSKVRKLWVGLWGEPDSPANRLTRATAELCAQQRLLKSPRIPLAVSFYDSSTARPWD